MTWKFLIFVSGSVLGLWALTEAVRRRNRDNRQKEEASTAPLPDSSPPSLFSSDTLPWPFAIAITLAIIFALQLVFRSGLIYLQGGDEYCRVNYAFDWARHPFFAPPDHVWLAGHFYALGLVYRLLGSMPLAVTTTSLCGVAATVFLSMLFARQVWGSATAGVFAGLLVGSEWFLLWASANPFAEVFFYPALVGALCAWVKAWQVGRERGRSERTAVDVYFILAAACMGFGTMFRFEMWYPGILFGVFLGGRFLWMLARPARRHQAWMPLVGCLLLAAYPLAWMIDNKLELGSYFAFLHKYIELNRKTNLFYDFSSVWSVLLIYPKFLVVDHWPRLALGGAGFLLVLFAGRRPRWASFLPVPVVLVFAMVITMRSGVGSNNRTRFTEFLMLPMLCYAAGALAYLWFVASGWKRALARAAVIGFVALATLFSVRFARETYPHAWGVSPEFLQITERLEREHDSGRPAKGVVLIQKEGTWLGVFHGKEYLDYWMIRYHSPWPENVRELTTPASAADFARSSPPGSHLLIRTENPSFPVPKGVTRLETIGPYSLYSTNEKRL